MLILALLAGCGEPIDTGIDYDFSTTATTDAGTWTVSWSAEPDPLPFNDTFSLTFDVPGAAEDLAYALDVTMPEHGHGMQVEPVLTAGEGALLAEGLIFHMAGVWELTLTVDVEGSAEDVTFWVDCCG